MVKLYLMRHAESEANVSGILAGQNDFPLSIKGKCDAEILANEFADRYHPEAIWCSPLLRAQQTAAPFLVNCDAPLFFDVRLMEQNLGRFSGMSYPEAESDPAYCRDRLARWNWVPDGGGESYEMISRRVDSFISDLLARYEQKEDSEVLIVTHAVTLRLFRACLERSLPNYPERIAANGEIWETRLSRNAPPEPIKEVQLSLSLTENRA